MSSEQCTVGVLGGRDPRGIGGVESVVGNIARHSSDRYEFVQYCAGTETRVEASELGTIRTYSDRVAGVRSKHAASVRAARDLRERDVDVVHAHGDNALGLAAYRPSVPYVMTFHGTTAGMYANVYADEGPLRDALSVVRPLPERVAARQCEIAVACSESVRDELITHYGTDPGKIVVIRNGVDTERFSPVPEREARERLGLDPDRRYVLWIGTGPRRKGLETAVRAVNGMDESVRLLVAGVDGDDSAAVTYLGRVPDELMASLYSAVDVQCLPSLYEGFPLVLLESLACGTPVVASPFMPRVTTGVRYVRRHVPAEYAEALTATLSDPPGRDAIREYAREYDWSRVAAKYTDLYDRMVSTGSGE